MCLLCIPELVASTLQGKRRAPTHTLIPLGDLKSSGAREAKKVCPSVSHKTGGKQVHTLYSSTAYKYNLKILVLEFFHFVLLYTSVSLHFIGKYSACCYITVHVLYTYSI